MKRPSNFLSPGVEETKLPLRWRVGRTSVSSIVATKKKSDLSSSRDSGVLTKVSEKERCSKTDWIRVQIRANLTEYPVEQDSGNGGRHRANPWKTDFPGDNLLSCYNTRSICIHFHVSDLHLGYFGIKWTRSTVNPEAGFVSITFHGRTSRLECQETFNFI